MKTILMMSLVSMISFSAAASTCDISVFTPDLRTIGKSEESSLKPEISKILVQKGYNVIETDESTEELLKNTGRMIVALDTEQVLATDGCVKFSRGTVSCGVSVTIGQVNANGELENKGSFELSQEAHSSLLNSQNKIANKFKQSVLGQVEATIPACK